MTYRFGGEDAAPTPLTGSPDHLAGRAGAAERLYEAQVAAAAAAGLLDHLLRVEMPWTVAVARCRWHGVRMCPARCRQVLEAAHRHLPGLLADLRAVGISDVRDDCQLRAFFDRLGLLDHFRRGRALEFDRDRLRDVEDRHPAVRQIRAARRLFDLMSSPVLAAGRSSGPVGRIHPPFVALGRRADGSRART